MKQTHINKNKTVQHAIQNSKSTSIKGRSCHRNLFSKKTNFTNITRQSKPHRKRWRQCPMQWTSPSHWPTALLLQHKGDMFCVSHGVCPKFVSATALFGASACVEPGASELVTLRGKHAQCPCHSDSQMLQTHVKNLLSMKITKNSYI